jgi:serine/threonine-protein kinase
MALTPGTRLGSYEVVGQIGRGGMGEVYRARDTRLGRDVAIKVLPESFARRPERIARFEREAKTLAALNHPNVAAIHGLEESQGTTALILELVEGPTLADRIGARPLSIAEALSIARQIADALEAAHDKGIIHRDLKPANIKVRPDGTVKVLDFGLAKAFDAAPVVDASESPTLTSPAATMAGVVMGTAAYMSPEQAEGLEVDQRSDIWSFGVVLYEMLTGARLFGGESVQRVMAKVLERDVDLGAVPPATPASIRRLLRRCLERDPKRRLHHIADARVEIDEALSGGPEVVASVVASRPAYLTWGLAVISLVLAAVAGFSLWRSMRTEPLQVARFEITRGALPEFGSPYSDVAVSPDGASVVDSVGELPADARLFLRRSNQIEATLLRGSERGRSPFFSPDGQRVGFIDDVESALKQVSVLGGPPTTIASIGRPIGGASWGPDDTIVFGGGATEALWQVSARGGEPRRLTTVASGGNPLGHNFPEILPNGKAVLFTMSAITPEASRIAVASLETGAVTELIPGGGQARYVPTGHILYGVDGTLRAVPFDQDRLSISGNPVPVVEDVMVKATGAAVFAVAGNGSLVYLTSPPSTGARRELVWVERDGRETHIAFADGAPAWPRLSPDGTRAAFFARDVWVVDLARGTPSRITDTGNINFVFWHPDGRRVLFATFTNGKMQMHLQSADGSGKPEPLAFVSKVGSAVSPEGWTADGRIVAAYTTPQQGFDIGILSPGSDAIQPFLSTQSNEDSLTISRDGRWIAYESDRTGQYEVYVERFPEGGDRRAISAPMGGEDPVWSHSGTELFYRRLKDKAMMVVPVSTGAAFTSGPATMLFQGNYYETGGRQYDVDREGRRFLVFKNVSPPSDSAPPRLILVQNFFEELKRLVPTN